MTEISTGTWMEDMREVDIVNAYFAAYQSGQYDKITPFFHPTFTFSDPSFPSPTPLRSRAVFHLFCSTMAQTELTLQPTPAVPTPDGSGTFTVRYTCDYVYGASKTLVHNDITAVITVLEGRVGRHVDLFDVGVWGRQALGWGGAVLGTCGVLEGVVRWWAGGWLEKWCAGVEEFRDGEVVMADADREKEVVKVKGMDFAAEKEWVFVK